MTNNVEEKLKIPAIGLIVSGILNALLGVYFVISIVAQAVMGQLNRPFASETEKIGYYLGFFGTGVFGLLAVIVAPVVIFGGVKMMKGEKYGLAKTSSILAAIPLLSCCFPVSIAFGIWSFIVLIKPEVKDYFQRVQ